MRRPEARHADAARPGRARGPRQEGEVRGSGGGGNAGERRGRRPLVVLDGDAAVQAAIGRRYSYSGSRLMHGRFYAYVDANAGRIALTAGARSRAAREARGMGGPRTKKRTAITEEIGAMASADASGHEAWLGRIEAMQRRAVGDPRSKPAKRWMRLRKRTLPMIIPDKGGEGGAAAAKGAGGRRARMLGRLYDQAESARLVAAEAARVAETGAGEGRRGARLVTMDPDILAFAGDLEAMTGGRLRVLDADRVSPRPTKRERAERAARLRRLVPRSGKSLTDDELKRRLGTRRLGRLTKIKDERVVVIVRERADDLILVKNGFVLCVGEGGGDQRMDRNNLAVRDSGPDGYDILLFERTDGDRLAFASRLRYVSHRTRWIDDEDCPFRGRFIVFKLKMVGGPERLREGGPGGGNKGG